MQNTTSNMSQSRSGASAYIDLSPDDFDICAAHSQYPEGPSAWVAVVPKNDPDITRIIQVGIIECRSATGSTCQGENSPHFFYAWGGCFPYLPTPIDMGPADYGRHFYALWLSDDAIDHWHLQIDGAPEGSQKHKMFESGQLGCWTNNMRAAQWQFERLDPSDSYGDAGFSDESFMFDARYGVFNQGWFNPLWADNPACSWQFGDSHCNTYLSDNMKVWDD